MPCPGMPTGHTRAISRDPTVSNRDISNRGWGGCSCCYFTWATAALCFFISSFMSS